LKFKNPRKNSGRQPLLEAFKSRRLRVTGSLVCISSGRSKLLLQAFQLNVKIRGNIREYDKEEA
jgi:hypothetical protein